MKARELKRLLREIAEGTAQAILREAKIYGHTEGGK